MGLDTSADPLELNQQLFREVNEKLRELATPREDLVWNGRTKYLCECGDQACLELLELTLDEYEGLRADHGLRAVVPGHESKTDDVMARAQRFHIVSSDSSPSDDAA
jgi:hypothetical protein